MFTAWQKFRRGKRARADVLYFERDLEENILELQAELRNGSYRHDIYKPFTVWDPKQRRIHKADVRDRLVHQAVVSAIESIIEPSFIFDSYSCRKGKGTHAGVKRLREFLRQASRNNTRTVYGLKCDIQQFFATVDHAKLLDLLSIQVEDKGVMALLGEITNSFSVMPGKGIPLGNLTSQLFANVYMHEFDWFVKHNLRQKYYVRYCDDFVIIGNNRCDLIELVEPIEQFLKEKLGLGLHPNKVAVRSWTQGIDFLGYVLKPHCILLRTRTKNRMLKRASSLNLPSYLGLCSHASCYRLQQLIENKVWGQVKK